MYRFSRFSDFANRVARFIAHPVTFAAVLLLVLVWLVAGPSVGFSSMWQAVFSSSATAVTFVLLFLIQHTQAREMAAIQVKLNELIRASEGAHNALLDIEQLTDRDFDLIRESYSLLANQAREQLKDGKLKWATARIQMESLDSLLDPSSVQADVSGTDHANAPDASTSGQAVRPLEAAFERLVRIASKATGAPAAVVSLADGDLKRLINLSGISESYYNERRTPLADLLCGEVVKTKKPVLVANISEHDHWKDEPTLAGSSLVASAGVPLRAEDGHILGAFCAMDHKPREWSEVDVSVLRDLADVVVQEMARNAASGAVQPGGASSVPASSEVPPSGNRESGAADGATILVVDDSGTNRTLLSARLGAEGYKVALSTTGQEALDYLKANRADLILLDIMLPGMDGEDVLKILQEDEALQRIPVVMISALDEQESVKRCLELGARDYLLKPFDPQRMQTCIRTQLNFAEAAVPMNSASLRIPPEKEIDPAAQREEAVLRIERRNPG